MDPIDSQYDKYGMRPIDSRDTERLEPEDVEVIKYAYPRANAQRIFTKLHWSPKDKCNLMFRCYGIIKQNHFGGSTLAGTRHTLALDQLKKYQIESGEKEREFPVWSSEDQTIMIEAYGKFRANEIMNRLHWTVGNKAITLKAAQNKIMNDSIDDQQAKFQEEGKELEEDRQNQRMYNDAYREYMDPGWYQGRDDDD